MDITWENTKVMTKVKDKSYSQHSVTMKNGNSGNLHNNVPEDASQICNSPRNQ